MVNRIFKNTNIVKLVICNLPIDSLFYQAVRSSSKNLLNFRDEVMDTAFMFPIYFFALTYTVDDVACCTNFSLR